MAGVTGLTGYHDGDGQHYTLTNALGDPVAGLHGVFALMVAESACVPIPSEATMLFAGFAVADPGASVAQHHLTLIGIVLAGVLGNLVGSWIAYGVGRAGRLELVERHGRWLHLQPRHIAWADRWFARYGSAAVFFSHSCSSSSEGGQSSEGGGISMNIVTG